MKILDNSGWLNTSNGTVSIDLTSILSQFSSRLSARTNGAITLPPGAGKITLLESKQLSQAQTGVKLLRLASIPLALAALAVLAIAVVISRDRRKTLRAVAIGVLAAGVVLIFIRRVVGDALIDSLTTLPANRDAAHAIWWVATERLAAANITVVTVGLLLLVGTWFAGPGRRATTSRKNLTPYLRDPAVAYGTYAGIVLLLLVWAPVPAARDTLDRDHPDRSGCDWDRGAAAARGARVSRQHRARSGASDRHESFSRARASRTPQAAPAATPGRYDDLERLADLHDRGVLTDAEFTAQKAAVLGG